MGRWDAWRRAGIHAVGIDWKEQVNASTIALPGPERVLSVVKFNENHFQVSQNCWMHTKYGHRIASIS